MKNMRTIVVMCLLTFLLLAAMTPIMSHNANATTWNPETVDSVGSVGYFTSIALDNQNNPHISYFDETNENLKYAKWKGSSWAVETVDNSGKVGYFSSLALDGSGNPHIVYFVNDNYLNADLKYARWTGTTWNIELIDDAGFGADSASIAIDSNGYPCISYSEENNHDLKYAHWDGSQWNLETIDTIGNVGRFSSVAVDSNDHPHISYCEYTNVVLKYAEWTGNAWVNDTVDNLGQVGAYTSMALDSEGYPHIGYMDYSNFDVKYASWTGNVWDIDTVDTTDISGGHLSMALDNNEDPFFTYTHSTNLTSAEVDLVYTMWDGTQYIREIMDTGSNSTAFSSIAIDGSGNGHISYFDYNGQDLKYVKIVSSNSTAPPQSSDSGGDIPSWMLPFSVVIIVAVAGVVAYALIRKRNTRASSTSPVQDTVQPVKAPVAWSQLSKEDRIAHLKKVYMDGGMTKETYEENLRNLDGQPPQQ